MCINGRQTSSVSRKDDEDGYRSKFYLYLTQSLSLIIHVFYSFQNYCVDYRGVNFKLGQSGSIDGCNRCTCSDGEGNAYWEGCTE